MIIWVLLLVLLVIATVLFLRRRKGRKKYEPESIRPFEVNECPDDAGLDDLNRNEKLSVVLRRDSVCAGDDIDAPHEEKIVMPSTATLAQLFLELEKIKYLPSIAGKNESWEAYINQKLICRFGKNIDHPTFVVNEDITLSKFSSTNSEISVQLRYFSSLD